MEIEIRTAPGSSGTYDTVIELDRHNQDQRYATKFSRPVAIIKSICRIKIGKKSENLPRHCLSN